MFRKRQTEQVMIQQNEREMDQYLGTLVHDSEYELEDVKMLFLEEYPGEESYFDEYVSNHVE